MTEYGQMPGNPEYKSDATSQHKTSHHYKDAPVTALLIVVYGMTDQCFGPTTQPLNLEQQHSQVLIIIDSFLLSAFPGSLCETVPGSGVIPMTLLSKPNSSALGLLRDSYKNNTATYKAAITGGNMRSGIHMSLGHYGGTTYAKVMSMGGFNCLIQAGDTIQTLLEHHFPKRSDPLTIPGVVTAEWKIVQALCTGNSIRNVKTPCCVSRSMVLEMTGLYAQDLIQDVYALGVNKPGNGEDFLLFDIEELTCYCGSKGCPKFLPVGFDGWLTIWGKCWVSFIDKRKGYLHCLSTWPLLDFHVAPLYFSYH